ncbi:MAG: type II secretion system F family protein [Oscillospiraceae bacterium]|nr:type II secretion system F family protein [Oscillospiraceae bacterium]
MTETALPEQKKTLRQLSSGDLSIFCLQLSLVLKAGIPLHDGLVTLGDKNSKFIESKQKIRGMLGKSIDSMADMVELGEPLASAMKKTGVFPDYVLNMVSIGESTGKLDNVLEALGEYYEKDQYMKTKIRNSLMYPVFLFVIMSVVIVLLVSRVFPIFKDMLESMGGSLSAGEEAVAAFAGSLAAGEYTMYIILALSVIFILTALLLKTSFGKSAGAAVIAACPLTRGINRKISASRFAGAMAMTLSGGMEFNSAMQMAVNLIDNKKLKNKFTECMKEIEAGGSFAESVAKTDVFSGMYIKFIEVGQKTGSVDAVMKKISDICDTEADTSINNATSVVEPLLVGILSIIIGIILISVMIPLVQVMSSIA